MAMYYYARRLQKSSKKNRTIHRDPIALNTNGSIPSVGSICTPVKVSNKVSEVVVGSVTGPGLGAPSTSSVMMGAASSPSIASVQLQLQHLNLRHALGGGSSGSGGGSGGVGVTVTKASSSANSKSSNSNSSPSGGGGGVILQHAQVYSNCSSNDTTTCATNVGAVGGGLSHKSSSHLGKAVNHHVISGNLVFDDGHLFSGTLEGLVDYLVPSEDHFPDKAFLFAFILSSRIYIRPHQLLATVLHRAFLNKNEEESIQIVSNLVRLLGDWTQIFPYDFRDDNGLMMANVRAITHKCVHICPSMKKEVSVLLTSLLDRLTLLEKFESNLAKINLEIQMASNHGMEGGGGSKLMQLCSDPRLIAEQLTLLELERFSFIGVQEFIQAFIKEPYSPPSNSTTTSNSNATGDTPSPVVHSNGGGGGSGSGGSGSGNSGNKSKKSRLESYVEWFHRLSLCISTDICKTLRKKDRVRVLEFWAEVGSASVTLGNFNSAIAIFTAINSNPVRRLIKTWSKFTGAAHLLTLEGCFDPTNNFSSYRSRLKGGGGGSSSSSGGGRGGEISGSVVVMPFFSLLIKDLFFLKEAASSRLPNGHLAFSNFLLLGSNLGEVMRWQQQKAGELNKVPHLIRVIQTMVPAPNESALMLASFECEGPSTPEEKGMLESLRRRVDPQPEDEELTDSFQSLPLPSTSSGSTSGVCTSVHEDDSVGLSPTEIHKLLQFKFAQNHGTSYPCSIMSDIFSNANNTLLGLGGSGVGVVCSEVQVHQPPQEVSGGDQVYFSSGATTDTGTIKQIKQKPPVPL